MMAQKQIRAETGAFLSVSGRPLVAMNRLLLVLAAAAVVAAGAITVSDDQQGRDAKAAIGNGEEEASAEHRVRRQKQTSRIGNR